MNQIPFSSCRKFTHELLDTNDKPTSVCRYSKIDTFAHISDWLGLRLFLKVVFEKSSLVTYNWRATCTNQHIFLDNPKVVHLRHNRQNKKLHLTVIDTSIIHIPGVHKKEQWTNNLFKILFLCSWAKWTNFERKKGETWVVSGIIVWHNAITPFSNCKVVPLVISDKRWRFLSYVRSLI